MFSTFQPWSDFVSWTGATLKCSCHAAHSSSLAPLPPLLGYFIGPLSSRDSSSGDWVWLVFTTNPDTWFHWGRWDLKGGGHGSPNPFPLHSMMHWARAADVRNSCASLLLSPLAFALSVSSWRHNALNVWVSVSIPFLMPEIRILRSCRLWGGQFSRRLIKRWRWKWGFGDRLPLIWFQRARQQWSCRSAPSQLSIQVTTPLFRLYSDLYYRTTAWTCLFSAVTDSRTLISSFSCRRKKTRVTDTKLPSHGQFWIFTDIIKHWLLTRYLNEIKTNINHMVANFIKPAMKANRRLSGPHLYLTIYI